jgi:hypothetical protein
MKNTEVTKVEFYIEPNGEVMAAFPEIPYAHTGDGRACYSHVGQHSGYDPDYLSGCFKASPAKYAELKAELESIGYVLEVLT